MAHMRPGGNDDLHAVGPASPNHAHATHRSARPANRATSGIAQSRLLSHGESRIAPAFVLVTKYPRPLVEFCRIAPKPTVVSLPVPLPKVIVSRPVFGA